MSKQKPKRPTTRQLKNDITVIVKEILNLKKYVNDVPESVINNILLHFIICHLYVNKKLYISYFSSF